MKTNLYFIKCLCASLTALAVAGSISRAVETNVPPLCPFPVSLTPTNPVICSGTPVMIAATATNGRAPYAFFWFDPVNHLISTNSSVSIGTPGRYHVDVADNASPAGDDEGHCVTEVFVTVTTGSPPRILSQPADQSACDGGSAIFSVTASADATAFQWFASTNHGSNWDLLTNETHAAYTNLAVTPLAHGNQYVVVVSALNGCSTNSAPATLAVTPLPPCSIDGPAKVCPGSIVSFSASPGSASYQWSVSGSSLQGPANSQAISVKADAGCGAVFLVTLTVTDTNHCSGTCIKMVTIADEYTPEITTLPPGGYLGCNPVKVPTDEDVQNQVVASDACGTPVIVAVHDDLQTGCLNSRTFTVVARNICGNTSVPQTVVYTWTADTTPPVISLQITNVFLAVRHPCQAAMPDLTDSQYTLVQDDCATSLTVTQTVAPNSLLSLGITTNVMVASDGCGNLAYATNFVIVQDTNPPTLVKGAIGDCYKSAEQVQVDALAATKAEDNCGSVSLKAVVSGTCRATVTVIATDASGNSASVSYDTRIDNTPPNLLGLPPATASYQSYADVPPPANVTASDECQGIVPVSFTQNESHQGSSCQNVITRTWTASDTCGNANTFIQTITVNDALPPVLLTVPPGGNLGCKPTTLPTDLSVKALVSASDNAGVPTVTVTHQDSGTACAPIRTFTIQATDACGNTSPAKAILYTWSADTTPPTLVCPPNTNITTSTSGSYACSVTDTNSASFNGTSIPAGSYIWFNASCTVSGAGRTAAHLYFQDSTIKFTANGVTYLLTVPDSIIGFDPKATCVSRSYDSSSQTWTIVSPLSGSDEIFLSGLAFVVPSGGFPGGINPVAWSGTFLTDTPGLSFSWKWSAAVYSRFSTDYNALGVKPAHTSACGYYNSEHAGTPESYKYYVVGGARCGGGSDFIGSWSGTHYPTFTCTVDEYTTYTQGGWGACPHGGNAGALLAANFATMYPSGYVKIGITNGQGFCLTFTSAAAIDVFLPAGGTPMALNASAVNPVSTHAGAFAGQVLALQLNVDFGSAPALGTAVPFGNLVYTNAGAPLNGKTVRQILAVANSVLGGGALPPGVTICGLNDLCDDLNGAFDGCRNHSSMVNHLVAPREEFTPPSPDDTGYATATDNCTGIPVISWSDTVVPANCAGGWLVSRTWVATDSCGNQSTCTQMITVNCPLPAPLQLVCSGGSGQVRKCFSSALVASGGTAPYSFSIVAGGLPPGLSLDTSTGLISGTPTTSGAYSFTAAVIDASGAAATSSCAAGCTGEQCTITIVSSPLVLGCAGGSGQVGTPYSSSLLVSGGTPPYTFSIFSGSLPSGLTLNTSTGLISGTPSAGGTWTFVAKVKDSAGVVAYTSCGTGCSSPCNCTITIGAGAKLGCGDTATIGFWHNKNGQALINSLNGGANSTALGNWLAGNYPYLFGVGSTNNLANKPNTTVAALFQDYFNTCGKKVQAQVLASALACYVTDSALAGSVAASYGFDISVTGTGALTYNVRYNGTGIGLANNTSYTVSQLLQQANAAMKNGTFAAQASYFNAVFDGINSAGDIRW